MSSTYTVATVVENNKPTLLGNLEGTEFKPVDLIVNIKDYNNDDIEWEFGVVNYSVISSGTIEADPSITSERDITLTIPISTEDALYIYQCLLAHNSNVQDSTTNEEPSTIDESIAAMDVGGMDVALIQSESTISEIQSVAVLGFGRMGVGRILANFSILDSPLVYLRIKQNGYTKTTEISLPYKLGNYILIKNNNIIQASAYIANENSEILMSTENGGTITASLFTTVENSPVIFTKSGIVCSGFETL